MKTSEQGQALVEAALTIPMMLFTLLGLLQMTVAWNARFITEYAAFKAARSGSVYRADCEHMVRAARNALAPTYMNFKTPSDLHQVLSKDDGRIPKMNGLNIPRMLVRANLENREVGFDEQIEGGGDPLTLRVRVINMYEFNLPLVNWIIVRGWQAMRFGTQWASQDPLLPFRKATPIKQSSSAAVEDDMMRKALNYSLIAARSNRYVMPIPASWSMRMMSKPMPNYHPNCQ